VENQREQKSREKKQTEEEEGRLKQKKIRPDRKIKTGLGQKKHGKTKSDETGARVKER